MIDFNYYLWTVVNCLCCKRYDHDLILSCPLDIMLADSELFGDELLPEEIAPYVNMEEMCPGFVAIGQRHGPDNTHLGQGLPQ